MAWIYEQKTGLLRHPNDDSTCPGTANGPGACDCVARGYSGAEPDGKNNPAMESVPDVGPIPRGEYQIGVPHDTDSHGPFVMSLTPAPANEMFGRAGFLMHGDSVHAPGTASRGCVILPRPIRERVWNSNDHRLQVVEGPDAA